MARRRPPDRFSDLLEAALAVFGERGPAATRMADVAAAMGVSPGSLYNYVASKDALFHWAVQHCDGGSDVPVPGTLPIPAPPDGATLARLRERIREAAQTPVLDAALARRRVRDASTELADILGERFDTRWRMRRLARVVERAMPEFPERFRHYAHGLERERLAKVEWYLERRIARGHLRANLDPQVVAPLLADTIDRFVQAPPQGVACDRLRAGLIDALTRGLVPGAEDAR